MKKLYQIGSIAFALLAGKHTAQAQCSGQFTVTYPNGTTTSYNNGSAATTYTYCPDGTGTATFQVTEGNNGGGGTIQVLNSAGTVIKTRTTTQNGDTVRIPLAVGPAGTSFTFRHTILCNNAKVVDVPFTLNPTLTLSASVNGTAVTTICPGTTVLLTASGATTGAVYTFRDAAGTLLGQNTSGTLNVTPTTSTFYTVATNTANCGTNTVTQRITISANELAASASPANVAPGGAATLTVSGGTGTYKWYANNGNGNVLFATTTNPSVTVNPTATTQYTVQGTTATGNCPDEAITRVSVNGNTLPVSLVSFTAAWAGSAVRLQWTTAAELHNAGFTVERSFDGVGFAALGRVAGQGTTATRTEYTFTDNQLSRAQAGPVYYRLVQHDLDGTRTFSSVQVLRGAAADVRTAAFPNPFGAELRVQLALPTAGPVTLVLHDHLGRTVRRRQLTLAAGAPEATLTDVADLPRGLYFLRVQTPAGEQQLRLMHE